MAYISPVLRQLITERAHGICEYCQTAQTIVIEMVIDHIEPESKGGLTVLHNLCLSCISCNSYKGDFTRYIDPHTGEDVPLFNPRTQQWSEHFSGISKARTSLV